MCAQEPNHECLNHVFGDNLGMNVSCVAEPAPLEFGKLSQLGTENTMISFSVTEETGPSALEPAKTACASPELSEPAPLPPTPAGGAAQPVLSCYHIQNCLQLLCRHQLNHLHLLSNHLDLPRPTLLRLSQFSAPVSQVAKRCKLLRGTSIFFL